MELYGSDDAHDFWWDGPSTHAQPYGLWNITKKGDLEPTGGYISKQLVERTWRTRFDNLRMKRV